MEISKQSLTEEYNDKIVIKTDSPNNKYDLIFLENINKFPYFLICNIIARYDIENIDKYINAVGMLIGPNIILTVAHNLVCEINNKIYTPTKIFINLTTNCDFQLVEGLKSKKSYVPEEYITALKAKNHEEQLLNDWGLIFLQKNVGDYIKKLLDLETAPELKKSINPIFYDFFLLNKNKENDFKNNDSKISILGYTVYRTKGTEKTDNIDYKFKDHFVNIKTSEKSIRDSVNVQMSIKELKKDNFFSEQMKLDLDNTNNCILGEDYIIFNNKDYIKKFSEMDKDKLIMSESKGELDDKHDNIKSFKYQISTYKGQSGSPIFLRKLISKPDNLYEDEYEYEFIGLHSRSDRYFYAEFSNSPKKESCLSVVNNQSPYKSTRSLIKPNIICKLALHICGKTIKKIEDIVSYLIYESSNFQIVTIAENKNYFVHMKIFLNDEVKLSGLFKKNVPLWFVFNLGANILNLNNEFILLKEMNPNSVIQNFNYDSYKLIQNIMYDNNCFYLNFELLINIKLYGEVMATKILLKFLENYDIEEKQLKKLNTSNKLIKKLFSNVFSELSNFTSMRALYGRLFTKIKYLILKKLEIEENSIDNVTFD